MPRGKIHVGHEAKPSEEVGFAAWHVFGNLDDVRVKPNPREVEHGNCLMLQAHGANQQLANLAIRQHSLCAEGKICADGNVKLEEIGFVWRKQNENWDSVFKDLKAHEAEHGDCNVQ